MARPKILLYLHHVDLGQRYPVSDQEVVIGRNQGHILFPKDERLSSQHCRVFLSREGMCVQDLGSANGTVIDGRLMSPQKTYPVRDGTIISCGGQAFRCVEPSNPKNLVYKKKKGRRRNDSGLDLTPVFFVAALSLLGYVGWKYQKVILKQVKEVAILEPIIVSPFAMVYVEIQEAYAQYTEVGKNFREGKLSNKQLAAEIRSTLVPKFTAAQSKISVLRPSSEFERRRIEANDRLVKALLAQVTAMAKFMETNDVKYSAELDKIRPELEAASEEARKLNEQRLPAGQNY